MKKGLVMLSLVFPYLFASAGIAGGKDVFILKFYTDPVYVYETAERFREVPQDALPDPGKTEIIIENFDYPTNMVMFMHQNQEMWVSQSEVKLNKTAVASVICTKTGPDVPAATPPGTLPGKPYATMGLGEGCK